jgi:cysteine synthase A
MNKLHNNILETIGNTPIVRLNKLGPKDVNVYVKVESFNPGGSVKDRLALSVIEAAEKDGSLKPGQTVIEATSGNTGIGLAIVCAQKGYPLVVTMAESFSVERRRMMRFLGAKVVLTPAELKGSGMLAKATELAEKHGWFLVRQFENEANADAHTRTTAPEILEAFGDQKLDYWVTGFGTGGTLKGVARYLKAESPETRIIVCEPDNAQILGSGIPQERLEDVVDAHLIDGIVPIDGNDALRLSRELAQLEGIFVGTSGGATLAGALAVAEKAAPGSNVLCMLPDTGERYLSTPLFDDIPVEMSEEEQIIMRSTPNFCFGAPPPPPPAEEIEEEAAVEAPGDAVAFLSEATHDSDNPVVLFALEWCEFCWSVRKMLAHYEIPYRAVDLDSVAYQEGNKGGNIRKAIEAQTGLKTIPQIYIGGKHIGGATDLFDAAKDGTLAQLLEANNVTWNKSADQDPYSFLPKWLHKR